MQTLDFAYHILRCKVAGEAPNEVLFALSDPNTVRLNTSTLLFAGQFANAFQEKVLDAGNYQALLQYPQTLSGEWRELSLELKGERDSPDYRLLRLSLPYYLENKGDLGYWAWIPGLNIEVFSRKLEALPALLEEVLRNDLERNKRLEVLQRLIMQLWYEHPEFKTEQVELKVYTPSELEQLKKRQAEKLIDKKQIAPYLEVLRPQVYGYERELGQLADLYRGQFRRSILIKGPTGVGKTALIWELSRRARELGLEGRIRETTAATLIKSLTEGGGWQEGLARVCEELRDSGDWLFVRNLFELFEVGQYEGNQVSMGDFLRDYLQRGDLLLLSECSEEELAKIELRSPGYGALFQILSLEEPREGLENIILQKAQAKAKDYGLRLEAEAVAESIRLSRRYTPYSGFPGKPIRFLEGVLLSQAKSEQVLDRSGVIRAFCEETGMPPFMVDPEIPMDLDELRGFFHKRIFGQDHAIEELVNVLAAVKTALLRPGKPIASLLLVGPTGVGKTELAKTLAEFMFGHKDKMLRFDMSEFSTPDGIARLLGEGFYSDGLLTSAVRRDPFCVLLFDELEKAHPLFNDLLLQMLGEGRLTDSQGKVVNFCSTLILMTSNIGASKLQFRPLGWREEISQVEVAAHFEQEVRQYFRPEIFNRLDRIIPFFPLPQSVVAQLTARALAQLRQREGLRHRNWQLDILPEAQAYLSGLAYDVRYGARGLQRSLHEALIQPLALALSAYRASDRIRIEVGLKGGEGQGLGVKIEQQDEEIQDYFDDLQQQQDSDFAASLRQKILNLREGAFFRSLQYRQERMARELREQGADAFWANAENSRLYPLTQGLIAKVEAEIKAIEALETRLALETFDLQEPLPRPEDPEQDPLRLWKKSFSALQIELYSLEHPRSNRASLGIYRLGLDSKGLPLLRQLYEGLFEQRGYTWSLQSLWYEAAYYQSEMERLANKTETEAETAPQGDGYLRLQAEAEEAGLAFIPPSAEAVFLGWEYQLEGPGVWPFFKDEAGFQAWVDDNKQEEWFKVECSESPTWQPELHRLRLGQQKIRRSYSSHNLSDSLYGLSERFVPNETRRRIFLHGLLDRRFSRLLDEALG